MTPAAGEKDSSRLDEEAVARYVLSRRTPAGGYCFYRTPSWGIEEPNALDTLAAVASLGLLGVQCPNPEETGRWVQGLQREDGTYSTLTIGWAALSTLNLLGFKPSRGPWRWLDAACDGIIRETAGPHRDQAGTLIDLDRLVGLIGGRNKGQLHPGHRKTILDAIERWRDSKGGWVQGGPTIEVTAVAVRLASRCGQDLSHDASLRDWVRACEDPVHGFRICPGAGEATSGALWGGLFLLDVLGGMEPKDPKAVDRNIALLQRKNGGLGPRPGAIATLFDTWTGLRAYSLLRGMRP